MYKDSEYCNLRDIGKQYGKSSHQVGRALKEAGWRVPKGFPTFQAQNKGFARRVMIEDYPVWLWHKEIVEYLLERRFGWELLPIEEGTA